MAKAVALSCTIGNIRRDIPVHAERRVERTILVVADESKLGIERARKDGARCNDFSMGCIADASAKVDSAASVTSVVTLPSTLKVRSRVPSGTTATPRVVASRAMTDTDMKRVNAVAVLGSCIVLSFLIAPDKAALAVNIPRP